ncbi:LutB/LldF family L-lactate oxidation iron-sulfur protein [Azospirillum sp.]|uniref:LutB/LldF family L-lactate oxidation iron-sulfur protein n=1 Tax=Azospirillum sp. TaxID=34012 RepID=UPI002D609601|nr:LutB/LldF family L-lactate oxidation iron-sulfur protein [Azospirillum sp.]HYD64237.1 LutB/LldF family L-lactate oxidation iron-sulfur protein [Azospirillum sp.]
MHSTAHSFPENSRRALENERLQYMLRKSGTGFQDKRRRAAERLPEFEDLRDQGKAIKNHVLENLDVYLEMFEAKVTEQGGHVHWCRTAAEARDTITEICRNAGAKTVTKGKSMIAEEIAINDHLESNGFIPIETDLGEYIIQLRKEPPSHIIAPAFHVSKEEVADAFRAAHTELPKDRPLDEPRELITEARLMLRRRFQEADVGITGANLLIAETGSTVIVTNEGNGDLTQTLPKVHVVLASIEKIVPNLEDAATVLRLLARSATGQEFSAYTTFSTGPHRPGDVDGPAEFHVVLLDNGRSALLGTEFQEVLRCIRCGACMNHCPVYGAVGGHAYGWVYPGPIGAVLDPALIGIKEAGHLPNASTFCGRCEAVCPMRIPLPKMMRHWREKEFEQKLQPPAMRRGLGVWAWFARRPALYHAAAKMAIRTLGRFGRGKGRFASLPLADGWTRFRDMPAPEGRTFQDLWAEKQRGGR